MNQEEYRLKLKEKIEDFTRQIMELKTQVVDASIKESFDSLITEMEKTRDLIQKRYDTMEASGESEWTKLEKNIYTDIESFNEAYRKAGSLFKPRH